MAHRDIGAFHHSTGDLVLALRAHNKSRDFCTTATHVLEMALSIIEIALESQNYTLVRNHVIKAEAALDAAYPSSSTAAAAKNAAGANVSGVSTSLTKTKTVTLPGMSGTGSALSRKEDAREKERSAIADKLIVAMGIAELSQGHYYRAARSFLRVGPGAKNEDAGHFINPADLGIYATLCALATFARVELRTLIVDNADLRPLLELEPHLKDVINAFYESRYKNAIELLDRFQPRYLLDCHLSHHVAILIGQIRDRAITQYFAPFNTSNLTRMAQTFGFTDDQMESAVVKLIRSGQLKARMDSTNKVIKAFDPSKRSQTYSHALKAGEQSERQARALLLRLRLIANDILVKGSQQGGGQKGKGPRNATEKSPGANEPSSAA